ncbi:MAG: hypothetical protein CMO55_28560 [Verrucomicrobiales bacterium]|nr:hypothetical protein [Verrucomicrobiales bacterium]
MRRVFLIGFWVSFALLSVASARQPDFLSTVQKKKLAVGEALILERRPDEKSKPDSRFVTVARQIPCKKHLVWEVVDDKENATDFLDGVLESKVIERKENSILVEQLTHVGGPKGAYRYKLRHNLRPHDRADFAYAGGELKNVIGTWWFYDGPDEDSCIIVYSLHIDAGVFAPQFVVKRGMKKSMPKTLRCVYDEALRRKKLGGNG